MRLIRIEKANQQEATEQEQGVKEKRTQNTMYVQLGHEMLERAINVSRAAC
jgi:hypothetical protein